jgi:hypothetical protein
MMTLVVRAQPTAADRAPAAQRGKSIHAAIAHS